MKLYWYLKKSWAEKYLEEGMMGFGHCSRYSDSALTTAQRDSEDTRSTSFTSSELRLRAGPSYSQSVEVPIESVEFSSRLPQYYLRSFSSSFRHELLSKLNCDAVIEIFDPAKLFEAIDAAVSEQHNTGPWRFVRKPVTYLSRREIIEVHDLIERIFVKDRDVYGTQDEFRVVLIPEHNFPGISCQYLSVYLRNVQMYSRRYI